MRSKAPFFFFCLSTTCGAYRMTAPRCQFCTLFFFSFFLFFVGFHSVTRIVLCTVGHLVFLWMLNVHCSWPLLTAFVLFFFSFFFWQSDVCAFVFMWNVPMYSCGVLTRKCERLLDLFHATCCLFFSLSLLQHSVASCVSALLFWELWSAAFFFSFLFRCSVSIWCCCVAGFSYFSWPSLTRHLSFLFSSVFFFSGLQSRRKRGRRARINKQTNNKKKAYYGFVFHSVDLSFPVVYREEKKRKRVLFRGLPK